MDTNKSLCDLNQVNTRFEIRLSSIKLICLLSGILVIAFIPTFSNNFQLEWDDTWQVLENPLVHSPSIQELIYHFTHFWQMQYSPVNSLFYLIIDYFFGLNASAFHAASLLVHWVSSILVFFIVKKLIRTFHPKHTKSNTYAFFTSLIFAIHPLQVESVAWISASKIILYGFFTLVALLSYLKYLETSHYGWLIGTALAYLVGFDSKEQAIILPLNLILFDYLFERYNTLDWKKLFASRVVLEKVPFFLIAIGFWYFSTNNNLGSMDSSGYPLYQRLVFSMYSLSEYIFRFLAPVKLYFYHPIPISTGETLPFFYYLYIILVGIVGYFVWDNFRKGNRLVVFGFFFFLINLILVLHIIPLPRTVITADRYMYLSIIGIGLTLTWQVDKWVTSSNKVTLLAICFAWFIFLGVHTYMRTADWKDSEAVKASVNEVLERKMKEQIPKLLDLNENE